MTNATEQRIVVLSNGIYPRSKAVVSMTVASGKQRFASTSEFGYYGFGDVPVGETYIFTVNAERYSFAIPSPVISVMVDSNINFVGEQERRPEKREFLKGKSKQSVKIMKNLFVLTILFGGLTASASVSDAQIAVGGNYTLDQSVVAAGGGTSAGNTFKVEGTTGQTAAGTKQFNSPYNFYSGFWTAQPPLAPTAASVTAAGRVLTASGRGIRNVRVILTGANGETRTTISGASGYFRFADIQAGETYIFTAAAKRYQFSQPTQVRTILEDTDNIEFVVESTR